MRALQALSDAHGGTFFVQSGIAPGEVRGYWLIMESLRPLPGGSIRRSAQIHDSWAMSRRFHHEPTWRRMLQVYSLIYILRGQGHFRDDATGRTCEIRAGSLLCLFPGVGHVYAPLSGKRWDEINIEFAGPVFDAWMGAGMLDPQQPVRQLTPVDYWRDRIHQVVLPLAAGATPSLRDTGALLALIGEMCAAWQTPMADPEVRWADQAQRLLRALPPTEPLDLDEMGAVLGLGEQAFRKRFKRLCGVTPTEFRSRDLIERACQLLLDNQRPVKQIARVLGFGSEFYFSRRFKQIMGMTPGQYRQRALHA